MGTLTSANDEWIELRNNTALTINLEGWTLKATDGTLEIKLAGIIPADEFYLLERTDDNTVLNISADQIYTGALNNKGEKLELYDNSGSLIDSIDGLSGWPAGDNNTKQTMSRFDLNQWRSSKEPGGTPKAPNILAADIPGAKPQPISLLDKEETSAASDVSEVESQATEPQENKELAAVGKQTIQKPPFFLLIAGVLAVFSGAIILMLKKGLK